MKYLVFGGAGALGQSLVSKLTENNSNEVFVFSRDEAKHHNLKLLFPNVKCIVGDIRDRNAVDKAIKRIKPQTIINCSALKQVPSCEDYPFEAIQTNIIGTENIISVINDYKENIIKAMFISTDKACKPINSYGMTKSLAERLWIRGQENSMHQFNCVRYGNVLSSTGSVIPVFQQRITEAKDLEITDARMTRFLLTLEEAVELIFQALEDNSGQKIFIPMVKSAKITDIAELFLDDHNEKSKEKKCDCNIGIKFTGIRPGEKLHEILISEEEFYRTQKLKDKYVIHDIKKQCNFNDIGKELSSGDNENIMSKEDLKKFLEKDSAFTY